MGQPFAPAPFPQAGNPAPPKQGMSCGVMALIGFFVAVPVIGILAAFAIAGVRRYLTSAKSAEAKVTVAQIYQAASAAYDAQGKLCDSSTPVPREAPSGRKEMVQSSAFDQGDETTGWRCLKFSLAQTVYFSYRYEREGDDAFVVTAHGDLDADGNVSTYRMRGRVVDGRVSSPPPIEIVDEDE